MGNFRRRDGLLEHEDASGVWNALAADGCGTVLHSCVHGLAPSASADADGNVLVNLGGQLALMPPAETAALVDAVTAVQGTAQETALAGLYARQAEQYRQRAADDRASVEAETQQARLVLADIRTQLADSSAQLAETQAQARLLREQVTPATGGNTQPEAGGAVVT